MVSFPVSALTCALKCPYVANESHTISHAGSKLVDRMLSSVTLIIPRQLFKRTHQGPVNSKSFIEKGKVALCWKFFLCKNYFRLDLLIFRCGAANDVQYVSGYNKFLGHWVIKLIINDGGDGLTVVILWVCDRLSRGVGGEENCGCANQPLQWFLRRF